MPSKEKVIQEVTRIQDMDVDAALDPTESDGVYRDSRRCGGLLALVGGGKLELSPPTPRPKKG
ncbi:hypothetical protein [Streptomyces sp. NPDC005876]|jgi:hypothetical protein|uniref:hypothetical protein n=1 Tax=unclassified Streptomyces TaxID=2593676 RepID=UPI0033EB6A73